MILKSLYLYQRNMQTTHVTWLPYKHIICIVCLLSPKKHHHTLILYLVYHDYYYPYNFTHESISIHIWQVENKNEQSVPKKWHIFIQALRLVTSTHRRDISCFYSKRFIYEIKSLTCQQSNIIFAYPNVNFETYFVCIWSMQFKDEEERERKEELKWRSIYSKQIWNAFKSEYTSIGLSFRNSFFPKLYYYISYYIWCTMVV